VPVGGATAVTLASVDEPAWVLQLQPGRFTAFDARCPHQGCSVRFVSAAEGFVCPCHQSRFGADGHRIDGPAPSGLLAIPVQLVGDEVRTV
jgi:thiosulfate dehydrogenase [quinone] large subunit